MNTEVMNPDDVYFPIIETPFGRVCLIGTTMTDEREREIAQKYPVIKEDSHDENAS